jgi:hypothetical protein
MSGLSRKLWRCGVPTALFLSGLALVIAERAVGIAWALIVLALAWAAHRTDWRTGDRTPAPGRRIRRRSRAI